MTATRYDWVFTDSAGYTGDTYYAQVADRFTDEMWDNTNEAMATTPTYTDTDVALVSLNNSGRYGFNMPDDVPAGEYVVLVRKQTGANPAATDDVRGSQNIGKTATGRVVLR